jgi:hypothetical protein
MTVHADQLIEAAWKYDPDVSSLDELRALLLETAATLLMAKAADAPKLVSLRAWKEGAMEELGRWDRVWEIAGRPGPLGVSKAESTARYIVALQNPVVAP